MKRYMTLFVLAISIGLIGVIPGFSSAQSHAMRLSCSPIQAATKLCEEESQFIYLAGGDGGYGASGIGGLRLGQLGREQTEGVNEFSTSFDMPLTEIHRFGSRIPGDDSLPADPSPRIGEKYGGEQSVRLDGCISAVSKFRSNFSTSPTLKPEAFGSYVDSCTSDIADSDFLNSVRSSEVIVEKEALKTRLIQSVAKIELPDGKVCTVFIASKYHALTARHCYQDKPDKEIVNLSFGILRGKDFHGNPYQVNSLKLASDPISLDQRRQAGLPIPTGWKRSIFDFVVLSPSDSSQTFKIETPIGIKLLETVQEGTSLLLVSNFTLMDKDRGMRIDDLPSCRVVKYIPRKGFMKHRCQAIAGGSGAPIFLVQKATVSMIGMHIGPEGVYSSDNSLARDNEAILMPAELSSWIASSTSALDANELPTAPPKVSIGDLGFPMPHNYRPASKAKVFIDPMSPRELSPSVFPKMHSFDSKFYERVITTPGQVQ